MFSIFLDVVLSFTFLFRGCVIDQYVSLLISMFLNMQFSMIWLVGTYCEIIALWLALCICVCIYFAPQINF